MSRRRDVATSLKAARYLRTMLRSQRDAAPDDWRKWARKLFPLSVRAPFGEHHAELWEWGWEIERDSTPEPIVGIFARGGAKSSTAELLTASVGVRGKRGYGWYVRGTQERANDSLANIAALFESEAVETYYPAHAERMVSKYGQSRGWRSTRLRTAGGFTCDAIGLDTAARGLKVEDQRPDWIVLDDIDEKHDTERTTKKKTDTLTSSILPAGTERTAVLAIQNLIIPDGIFTQIAEGRADFLARRRLIGPVPAIEGLETDVEIDEDGVRRNIIVGGEPTWAGQDIEACQRLLDRIGLRTFLRECQHEVAYRDGALWNRDMFRYELAPETLVRVVVGVDPSGGGDAIGIIVAALDDNGMVWILDDLSQLGSAGVSNWAKAAVRAYDEHSASVIAAESNFGGNMVESSIRVAADGRRVKVKLVTASRGKAVRAEPVAQLYEEGRVFHVKRFPDLEQEMCRWVPGDKESPNRMDALVWAITELALQPKRRVGVLFPGMKRGDDEDASAA